jgi:hypothetical protein
LGQGKSALIRKDSHEEHEGTKSTKKKEGKYDEPPKPCPYEDDCEECPLHGFLTLLDTQ